ncbi:MAG: ABC transporter permease subunit [Planctomycetota bacterium]
MIARKTWREIRGMAIAYAVILELLLIPAVLLWPDVKQGLSGLVRLMPMRSLRDAFNAMMSPDDDVAYRAYLAVQVFFKGTNIVGIAGAVLLGTGLIARERENQTLEFLVSRPISRSRILWGKFWVVALILIVPIFVTSWTVIPLSKVDSVAVDIPFDVVTICCVHASAFVLAVLAITTLISVLGRSQVSTAFWIGAVVLVEATTYFVQGINAASAFRLSDFYVYGPVMAGNVPAMTLFLDKTIWLLVVAGAAYFAADRTFRKSGL